MHSGNEFYSQITNEGNSIVCVGDDSYYDTLCDAVGNVSASAVITVKRTTLKSESSVINIVYNLDICPGNNINKVSLTVINFQGGGDTTGLFNVSNDKGLTLKSFRFIISNGNDLLKMPVFTGGGGSKIIIKDCLFVSEDKKSNNDYNIETPIIKSNGIVNISDSNFTDFYSEFSLLTCCTTELFNCVFENIKRFINVQLDNNICSENDENINDCIRGLKVGGSALEIENGTLTINNCTFDNCVCENGKGGAIYIKLNSSHKFCLDINGMGVSTFKNCRAEYGGAICFDISDEYPDSLINSLTFFDNNKASVGQDYFIINQKLNKDFADDNLGFLPESAKESGVYNAYVIVPAGSSSNPFFTNLIVLKEFGSDDNIPMVFLKNKNNSDDSDEENAQALSEHLDGGFYYKDIYICDDLHLNNTDFHLNVSKYSFYGDYKTKSNVFPLNVHFDTSVETVFRNIVFNFKDFNTSDEEYSFIDSSEGSLTLHSVSFLNYVDSSYTSKNGLITIKGEGYIYGCVFKSISFNSHSAHIIHASSDLIINGTSFIECTNGEGDGGGLYVEGGEHVLIGGSNTYTYFGGCKAVHGGGMYLNTEDLKSLCVSDITFGVGSEKNIAISGTNIYVISLLDRDINLYSFPILSHQVISKENLYCEVDGDNSYVYNYDKKEGNPFTFSGDLCLDEEHCNIYPFLYSGRYGSSQGKERRSNQLSKRIQNDDDYNLLDFFNQKLDQSHQTELYVTSGNVEDYSCGKKDNPCQFLNVSLELGNYKNLKINVIDSVNIYNEIIECYYCFILGNKKEEDGGTFLNVTSTSEMIIKGESKIESFNCYLNQYQNKILFNIYSGTTNLVSLKIQPNETFTESYLYYSLVFVGYRGSLIIDKCSMKNLISLTNYNGSAISARIEYDCSLEIKQSEFINCIAEEGYGGGLYASVNKGGKLFIDKNSKGKTKFENCSSQKKENDDELLLKSGRGGAMYINIGDDFSNVNISISENVVFGSDNESMNIGEGRDMYVSLPDDDDITTLLPGWFSSITKNNDYKQYCYNKTKGLNLYLCDLMNGNNYNVKSSSRNTHSKILRERKSSFEKPHHNSSLISLERNITLKEDVARHTLLLSNQDNNVYVNGEGDGCTISENEITVCNCIYTAVKNCTSGGTIILNPSGSSLSPEIYQISIQNYNYIIESDSSNGDIIELNVTEITDTNNDALDIFYITGGSLSVINVTFSILISASSGYNRNGDIISKSLFNVKSGCLSLSHCEISCKENNTITSNTLSEPVILFNGGSENNINECNFSNINDKSSVINVVNGSLSIKDGYFSNITKIGGNGSSISAIVKDGCNISINNVNFIECKSENGNGGAIYVNQLNGNLSIQNTKFTTCGLNDNNSLRGGGIFIRIENGNTNLRYISFNNCSAYRGGNIYIVRDNIKEWANTYLSEDNNEGGFISEETYNETSAFGLNIADEGNYDKEFSLVGNDIIKKDLYFKSDGNGSYCEGEASELSCNSLTKLNNITFNSSDDYNLIILDDIRESGDVVFEDVNSFTLKSNNSHSYIITISSSDTQFNINTKTTVQNLKIAFSSNSLNNPFIISTAFLKLSSVDLTQSSLISITGSLIKSSNSLILSSVNISNINGSENGGAIEAIISNNCYVSISGCSFNNCKSVKNGGAIYADISGTGKLSIKGRDSSITYFNGCSASSERRNDDIMNGGALYININGDKVYINVSSNVIFNNSDSHGSPIKGSNVFIHADTLCRSISETSFGFCNNSNEGVNIYVEDRPDDNIDLFDYIHPLMIESKKSYSSICDAYKFSDEGDTILIKTKFLEDEKKEINIDHSITIQHRDYGENEVEVSLSVSNLEEKSHLFYLNPSYSDTTLQINAFNFILTNSSVIQESVFCVDKGTLNLYKCKFKREETNTRAAEVNIEADNLKSSIILINYPGNGNLKSCIFEGLNFAKPDKQFLNGGAIYAKLEGTSDTSHNYLKVFGCSFSGCGIERGLGGAIYVDISGYGELYVGNFTEDNEEDVEGGVVSNRLSNQETQTEFKKCSAGPSPKYIKRGAIYLNLDKKFGDLCIDGVDFEKNGNNDQNSVDLYVVTETIDILYADVNFPYILKENSDYKGAKYSASSVEDGKDLKSALKNKPRLWSKENFISFVIIIIVVLFIVAVIIILIIILCCSKRSNKKVEEKKESKDKVKNKELDDNLE